MYMRVVRRLYGTGFACFFVWGLSIFGFHTATFAVEPDIPYKLTSPQLRSGASVTTAPMDRVVDPNEYFIGPGDVLALGLWGSFETADMLTVTPEGTLLIPNVGEVLVAGLSLAQTKEKVKNSARVRYPNASITVTLVGMRRFKVSITGAVNRPGLYEVDGASRLSELVQTAGGLVAGGSLRRIKIEHIDGEFEIGELFRFQRTGDRKGNPLLRMGDNVRVLYQENWGYCTVSGAVSAGGAFEYSESDSLLDALAYAGGLSLSADSSQIMILRKKNTGQDTIIVDLRLPRSQVNLKLSSEDQIFVKTGQEQFRSAGVWVSGEVKQPGFYEIVPGKTRLSEVIERVGGFTERASVAQGTIFRSGNQPQTDLNDTLFLSFLDKLSPEEVEYYRTRRQTPSGRAACDFVSLFIQHNQNADILLLDGDYISIPKKGNSVYVMGRVNRPGLVTHNSDWKVGDFIGRAGGFAWNADRGKVRIIKGVSGARQKGNLNSRVDAGDTIWIPERRKRNYLVTLRDSLLLLGNIATIYLVVREATK